MNFRDETNNEIKDIMKRRDKELNMEELQNRLETALENK